jgi:cell wall-associated NlpC family hydrolase
MASKAALNGAAISLMAAGVVVAYSGIRNATVADTLRALIKGQPVPGSSAGSFAESQAAVATATAGVGAGEAAAAAATGGGPGTQAGRIAAGVAGGQLNADILASVAKYKGVPYLFGGADPKHGVDCSGLVTYVLHHDLGLNLPSNTHTITTQFYVWSGAYTVPWNEMLPGDLICWPGHIGIAASGVDTAGNATMWDAPHTGSVVQLQRVWKVPMPIVRRVKPQ